MKEALISTGPKVQIVESAVPVPGPGQLLIEVAISGSNPKDWKVSEHYGLEAFNSGDDIAGIVRATGPDVYTTFHIPSTTSFEEAATIPLAALTAAVLLFRGLRLPAPWDESDPKEKRGAFLVDGGASAVGSFAIQLARQCGFKPIIAVAGRGVQHVQSLLNPANGDVVIDYRSGSASVLSQIRESLNGADLRYALDAVRVGDSYESCANTLESCARGQTSQSMLALALPLPGMDGSPATREAEGLRPYTAPSSVKMVSLGVNLVHKSESKEDRYFGYIYSRYLGKGLQDGWLIPHPHALEEGGLDSLESMLRKLKQGSHSAMKYVVRIAEISQSRP